MSAADKKKAKKKAKDKEKKTKEKEAGAKGPKVTAAVRRMQEAQEARLRADTEAAAAEAERFQLVTSQAPKPIVCAPRYLMGSLVPLFRVSIRT